MVAGPTVAFTVTIGASIVAFSGTRVRTIRVITATGFSIRATFSVNVNMIKIYHECEGRIEKKPSRGSPLGITRLAER